MAPNHIRQWATVALKLPLHGHGIRVGQIGIVLTKPQDGVCMVEFMDASKKPALQCSVPQDHLLLLHLNDDALYPEKPAPRIFYTLLFVMAALISGASFSMAYLLYLVPQTVDVLVSGGSRGNPNMVHVIVNPLMFLLAAFVTAAFAWFIDKKRLRKVNA
ncbi:MAG: hypothetical protein IPL65_06750 [Lewinellaceae bacterium]|nr:hypothetical protein [Lewinellaceae bacterium]